MKEKWSAYEVGMLRAYPGRTASAMMALLPGRSATAIAGKRRALARERADGGMAQKKRRKWNAQDDITIRTGLVPAGSTWGEAFSRANSTGCADVVVCRVSGQSARTKRRWTDDEELMLRRGMVPGGRTWRQAWNHVYIMEDSTCQ